MDSTIGIGAFKHIKMYKNYILSNVSLLILVSAIFYIYIKIIPNVNRVQTDS